MIVLRHLLINRKVPLSWLYNFLFLLTLVLIALWGICAFLHSNKYFENNSSSVTMRNVLVLTLPPLNTTLASVNSSEAYLVI